MTIFDDPIKCILQQIALLSFLRGTMEQKLFWKFHMNLYDTSILLMEIVKYLVKSLCIEIWVRFHDGFDPIMSDK